MRRATSMSSMARQEIYENLGRIVNQKALNEVAHQYGDVTNSFRITTLKINSSRSNCSIDMLTWALDIWRRLILTRSAFCVLVWLQAFTLQVFFPRTLKTLPKACLCSLQLPRHEFKWLWILEVQHQISEKTQEHRESSFVGIEKAFQSPSNELIPPNRCLEAFTRCPGFHVVHYKHILIN